MDQIWDNLHDQQVWLDKSNDLQRYTYLLREGTGPYAGNWSSAGTGQLFKLSYSGWFSGNTPNILSSQQIQISTKNHPSWLRFFMVIFRDSKWTGLELWCRLQLHSPLSPLHYLYFMRCNILSSLGSVAEELILLGCYVMSEDCVGNCLSVDMI